MMKVCSEYNCTTPFCPMPRLVRSACGYSLAECLQFSESKLQRQPLHLHCSLALQSSLFKATHFFSHHLSGFFEPPIILVVWHPPTAAWCITPSSSAPRSGRNATVTRSKLQSKAARRARCCYASCRAGALVLSRVWLPLRRCRAMCWLDERDNSPATRGPPPNRPSGWGCACCLASGPASHPVLCLWHWRGYTLWGASNLPA